MTQSDVVTVRGLRRGYGSREAVAGIDLDIGRGEIVALLGPNGAGKTTTVEILEGHRARHAGEVRVLGADPWRAGTGWRQRIGIVPQQAADLGRLTVAEAVRHFAGYFPAARPADEVIELVGLGASARTQIRRLSGGQRRRLDVAVGVVGRPELLFLDEPTTGFDPQARRAFWELIRTVTRDDGTTVLLTTHYLAEAEALAGRVVVLAAGRIVAEGNPATLGGRATAGATVSWLDDGRPHRLRTDDPAAVVAELTARHGGPVPGLTVTRPSLEDIYLELIGGK